MVDPLVVGGSLDFARPVILVKQTLLGPILAWKMLTLSGHACPIQSTTRRFQV